MEINDNSHKMTNYLTKFENNGDIINGDCTKVFNLYIDSEEAYEILTRKDNYSDFYKSYISKFKELEDYAFSLFYPYFNKKTFDFTSNPLVFGKRIIDWVYGLDEFPSKEIQEFYNDLKIDFNFDDNTVIVKRWNANIAYFNSDVKQASENYSKLYDELLKCKNVPEWFLDDICIDGRNLLHQYENMINKISFDNKFQTRLSSNRHKLSYPDIDRIKSEIFESVSKNVFNNKNKSKYTTIYGIGLEECFRKIQDLVFLTIFYGSITHLKLVRELISNIMYMYADTFEDEEFYNLTLRMLFLSGEFKKYRNLYNKIRLNYSFVINGDFIKSIVCSRKALFKFEEDRNNVFLFDIYGRYLGDDLYLLLEKNMINIITIKDDYNLNIISDAFKAIATNIKRSTNVGKLLTIIKDYFVKSYSRFYMDFGRLLGEIDVNELTKSEFQDYQNVIDSMIKEKEHTNYDLSNCIVRIKERDPKITKYDNFFSKKGTHENIVYQIELENNEIEAIKSITNVYKERHEKREKNPGVYSGYMTDYNIGTNIFTASLYVGKLKEFILEEYLPLAQSIILSENEDIFEKNRHIKLLTYLLMVEKDETIKRSIIDSIHKAKEIKYFEPHYIGEMKFRNKMDLDINVVMFDVIAGIIKYEDALCIYLEDAIKSPNNIGAILDCLSTLNEFCVNKNDDILDKLFIIFIFSYEINDLDVRIDTIIMSNVFVGSKYEERVLEILEKRLENMVFEECKGYIQLIMNIDKDKRNIYSTIIEKLKNNKNYYVKYMASKYL